MNARRCRVVLVVEQLVFKADVFVRAGQVVQVLGDQVRHDLGVVAEMVDEVAVMYAGRIVEKAPTRALFLDMKMPYTEALLSAAPILLALFVIIELEVEYPLLDVRVFKCWPYTNSLLLISVLMVGLFATAISLTMASSSNTPSRRSCGRRCSRWCC